MTVRVDATDRSSPAWRSRKSIACASGGSSPTSSRNTDRTVDLSRDLVRTLQRHLTWLTAETLRRGWGEPEWLFPNEEGKPLDESRVRQVFRRALKRATPNPATATRFHAKWIPTKGRRWVDLLDRIGDAVEGLAARLGSKLGTKIWNQDEIGEPRAAQLPDSRGGPSRTRTLDPLIKSQLLYQLS